MMFVGTRVDRHVCHERGEGGDGGEGEYGGECGECKHGEIYTHTSLFGGKDFTTNRCLWPSSVYGSKIIDWSSTNTIKFFNIKLHYQSGIRHCLVPH